MKIKQFMKKMKSFFLLIMAALFIFQSGTILAQDTTDPRDQLEEINENKAALRNELSNVKQAENLALDELEEIDLELGRIQDKREQTSRTLNRKRDQLDSLNTMHSNAVADLEESQLKFESRLVEWYKYDVISVIGSLITTGDLSDFLDIMHYTEAIVDGDQDTIKFIQDQQGQILEHRQSLDSEIQEYERLLSELRNEETQYATLQDSRSDKLTSLSRNRRAVEKALDELEASSYEIGMMLQVSKYTGSSGPLIKPVDASITSGFGMRRHPILGRVRMHTGVDMPAPAGTPIHASGDGLVIYSGWKRGYGNTVIIDHGSGLATLYGHCSSLLVSENETVRRGQVIARVGTTGLSTGNHCHFEVRINGDPVDPVTYISGG